MRQKSYTVALLLSIALVFLVFGVSAAEREVDLSRPLSLEEVIQIALSRNAGFAAARRGVEVASGGVSVAQSQRLPKFTVEGFYNRSVWPRPLIMGTKPGDFSDTRLGDNFFGYGVTGSVPLFTGGRISSQIALNEAMFEMARDGAQKTRDDLIFNLAGAYYSLLRLQKVVEATQKSVEHLEESRRIVERKVEVGKAAKVDLFKINARLANVRQNLIKAQNALEVTHSALKTRMGLDISQRVEVSGPLEYRPNPYDLRASIGEALERNPAYRMAGQKVEVQRRQLRIARSQWLPNISAVGRYDGLSGFDTVGPSGKRDSETLNNWSGGVVVSFPLFNDVVRSQVGQASAGLQQAQQELDGIKLETILAVQTAYLNRAEAENRIKAAEAALQEAKESLRIEQLKLEEGKGIVNDLLDAQAEELQAEVNYYEALADYNTSHVALRWAIGGVDLHQVVPAK